MATTPFALPGLAGKGGLAKLRAYWPNSPNGRRDTAEPEVVTAELESTDAASMSVTVSLLPEFVSVRPTACRPGGAGRACDFCCGGVFTDVLESRRQSSGRPSLDEAGRLLPQSLEHAALGQQHRIQRQV